jgi:hypothetical protein
MTSTGGATTAAPYTRSGDAGAGGDAAHASSVTRRRIDAAIVLAAYVVLLLVTRTLDQGDTNVYAEDLLRWSRGYPDLTKWEFGHMLWRPLTYALSQVLGLNDAGATDGMVFARIITMLSALAMLSGAIAVVAFRSWLDRLGVARVPALFATVAFAASSAFLGYAQTGSSYIPALAMLVLGLRALAADDAQSDTRTIVSASIAFALAAMLWAPMVLGVPAAAISAIVLRGNTARRRRVAFAVCALSGTITILCYVPIALLAGVRSVGDLRAWVAESSHGIRGIGGLSRVIVGFGRSLVNMDRLGLVTKRHLIQDPYNPASWGDVASAGLFRLGLLYALLAAMALVLVRRPIGRRALALLIVAATPVMGFGLKWQGGDLERYLAMFPALFLAIAVAIASLPRRIQLGSAVVVPLLFMVVNVPAISRVKSQRECARLNARVGSVPRTDGKPVVLLTPHELDEIATFRSRCPGSPLLVGSNPPFAYGLVMANQETAPLWRQSIATRSAQVWARGGHVWISRRAFVTSPPPTWKWAEGDDPRLKWRDFPAYFSQLEFGPAVGGDDGFVELLPTPRNREAMARLGKVPPG